MKDVKLSAPWITFVHEVQALFADDPEVRVKYEDDEYKLKLYVDNTDKAAALQKLIPETKEFGNVTLTVEIIPSNVDELPIDKLFEKAFSGNPALAYTASYDTPLGEVNYAVFYKKVVQFFNDQLDDINGNKSMLFQDAAREVFGNNHGIFFCTDASGSLSKPLGEWP